VKQRILTILLLNTLVLMQVWGQTVPTGLVEAIGQGDASTMSEYFHPSLEMSILEKDYETSKNQAARIMESFFKKHAPTGFTVSFEGTKEQSKYAIGTLSTSDGTFRVNLFFITKEEKRLIYYLSIEKESQYELNPEP
jgi:hypothetical protein